jgi:hypothetical protein
MRPVLLIIVAILTGCTIEKKGAVLTEAESAKPTRVITVGGAEPDYNDLVSAVKKSKLLLNNQQSVRIEIAEGTYYLNETIVIGSEFSGTAEQPFVIAAKKDAQVVLSGALLLDLDWQPYNSKIYQAKVDDVGLTSLYVNSALQPMARYPDYDPAVSIFNGFAEDAISAQRVATWANPVGGFVHALHEGRWGGMQYKITGVNEDYSLRLEGGYQNNRASPLHSTYRFVENIFEELDAPGEWYLDTQKQTLYFYPPENIDITTAKFEAPQLDNLIELRGNQKTPVKHVTISGIEFRHTQPTFMQTKEQLLRSDWAIYRGGAILFDGTEHSRISDSVFSQLGGNAIFISNYNRRANISNNHIYNIGASAVSFVGSANAVRSPSFEYNEFVPEVDIDFEVGPKTDEYPSQSLVDNNLIHDIGLVEKQVAGVQLSMAANITISRNSIYRVPRAGINVSEGTWGGHVLEYNDVFDTVLETGDHGAFNSWGRDRFWHPDRAEMDRLSKAHPDMFLLDAIGTTIIRNNRFQCDFGWDIDLDDGSSNYEIYNNLMLSGGLKLREGFKRIVTNNIILNNAVHPHVWFESSQDVVERNILLSGHKPILNYHWGDSINHNLFANERDLIAAQALGLDKDSVFGDPQFVDPDNGNYQVKNDSPTLKIGFTNFPMDQFGVKNPDLKKLAEQPEVRPLFLNSASSRLGQQYELLGATLKSVETLGEQSALGISEIAGAMVLAVEADSKMARVLNRGDVILRVLDTEFGGADKIYTVADFLASYQSRKWRGVLELEILRNQQKKQITINLID